MTIASWPASAKDRPSRSTTAVAFAGDPGAVTTTTRPPGGDHASNDSRSVASPPFGGAAPRAPRPPHERDHRRVDELRELLVRRHRLADRVAPHHEERSDDRAREEGEERGEHGLRRGRLRRRGRRAQHPQVVTGERGLHAQVGEPVAQHLHVVGRRLAVGRERRDLRAQRGLRGGEALPDPDRALRQELLCRDVRDLRGAGGRPGRRRHADDPGAGVELRGERVLDVRGPGAGPRRGGVDHAGRRRLPGGDGQLARRACRCRRCRSRPGTATRSTRWSCTSSSCDARRRTPSPRTTRSARRAPGGCA